MSYSRPLHENFSGELSIALLAKPRRAVGELSSLVIWKLDWNTFFFFFFSFDGDFDGKASLKEKKLLVILCEYSASLGRVKKPLTVTHVHALESWRLPLVFPAAAGRVCIFRVNTTVDAVSVQPQVYPYCRSTSRTVHDWVTSVQCAKRTCTMSHVHVHEHGRARISFFFCT